MSMCRDWLRQSGLASEKNRSTEFQNYTHTHTRPVPLLVSYLEPWQPVIWLVIHVTLPGAYHIIRSDVHFHPIRFPFVLAGCSDANLLNSAHFHFPLQDCWQIHEQTQKKKWVLQLINANDDAVAAGASSGVNAHYISPPTTVTFHSLRSSSLCSSITGAWMVL